MEQFRKTIIANGKKTDVIFYLKDNVGLNIAHAIDILVLAKKYLNQYPCVQLSLICDYYYLDHSNDVTEERYLYDDTGVKYEDRDDFARYWWDEKMIGFNHILCQPLPHDNIELMSWNKIGQNIAIGDVAQIKQYEREKTIATIFKHEFAHAIENQLEIYKDEDMVALYESSNRKNDFKDIHEFIAECFVVNEYFPLNSVVRKTMKIIDGYVK